MEATTSMERDPFAAPRQAIPDPSSIETDLAWTHAKYRCPLGQYINLMREDGDSPTDPSEDASVEIPTNPNGVSTWAAQEQRSIEDNAA
jgi:hypothetical protein